MANVAGNQTLTAVLLLVYSSVLILLNLGLLAKSRFISRNTQVLKGRISILGFSLVQMYLGISISEGFYDAKTVIKRLEQIGILLSGFIFLLIVW